MFYDYLKFIYGSVKSNKDIKLIINMNSYILSNIKPNKQSGGNDFPQNFLINRKTQILQIVDEIINLSGKKDINQIEYLKIKRLLKILVEYIEEINKQLNEIDINKLESQVKDMHAIVDQYKL
jgi:hypothetical protein